MRNVSSRKDRPVPLRSNGGAMHCLFIALVVSLAFVLSAHGHSVEVSVSPNHLDVDPYAFLVLTNVTDKETMFHVTISNKQHDISPDCSVKIATIQKARDVNGSEVSITPLNEDVSLVLKKQKRAWAVDFNIPRGTLENQLPFFVFGDQVHETVNGTTISMPSITFYELRLQDFLKRTPERHEQ